MTQARAAPQRFYTLDGLRGLGAMAVVAWHTGVAKHIPGGYLAVDLFFCLSGFVLAHAYEGRRLGFLALVRSRVLRLYPMYLAGLVLGALVALTYWRPDSRYWLTLGSGLLMLPVPPAGDRVYYPFPFDGPAWSLFFEMVINLIWFAVMPWLRWRLLIPLVLFGGVLLVSVVHSQDNLSLGLNIGASGDHFFLTGLSRIFYSFFMGVAVYRLWRAASWRPALPAIVFLALLAGLLIFRAEDRVAFGLATVIAVFPVLIYLAASSRPGPRVAWLCAELGALSYGVYVLHFPLRILLRPIFYTPRGAPEAWVLSLVGRPWSGYPFALTVLLAAVGLTWVLHRFYDEPVRAWLGRLTRRQLAPAV